MKQYHLPQCPHCGNKLNYAQAWVLKRRGEYICPKCGGISNIVLGSPLYAFGFFAIVAGTILCILGLILDGSLAPFTLGGVFLLFLLFFLIAPFQVRLRKPLPRRPIPPRAPQAHRQEPPRGGTAYR